MKRTSLKANDIAPSRHEDEFSNPFCPMVVMGASAGGLEVFEQFFKNMPSDTGMAFVLVQHLDPKHDTLMPELLSKQTAMPVVRADDGLKLRPNTVYVIPPNGGLTMDSCTLRVGPLPHRGEARVIDAFFRSAARDQKENVIGIILSGTGTDGTLGLRAIKEEGGLTMVQLPETAKFDGMPRNAIASGFVDCILPVTEMPERVLAYIRHVREVQHRKGGDALQREIAKSLPPIALQLRKKTGHDFSRYKQSTLTRRIQRRMQLLGLDSVVKYMECLAQSAGEVEALFKDLLIGVTQFFRDRESFEVLAQDVIPTVFQEKRSSDAHIRVWIPGCATGEEAYTFAMLLAEYAENLPERPKIQIFATDLDSEALDFARKGKYPIDIVGHISPERLRRFFRKSENSYEVVDSVRELCVFSPHNLIKDPPFSRLDIISCRNVLIYLEVDLQKKLLPLFHYALNPSGFLFLGPSENVASRSELFRTVDPKHRIFQRKPMVLHKAADVPLIDQGPVTKLQTVAPTVLGSMKEANVARSIERLIIEEFAPASVVINEQGDVVYFAGDTGKFLKPPAGSPNNKLVAMARQNLRLELRTLIHRAVSSRKEAVRENLLIRTGKEDLQIDLVVRPLTELGAETGFYIVLFRELVAANHTGSTTVEDFTDHEHPIIKQLEGELRTTREDLQTTIEELETSNEELKSANEELLSTNEELQSANEELQTSKEEVQSANDELQRKIEETEHANFELRKAHLERAELASIVQSSEDAIIGKTLEGIVTSWNRAAERIFGYSPAEMIGQSILRIVPPERHEEERGILKRLRAGDRVEHYETDRITKSGRIVQVSLSSSPIRDAQGFVVGASKIVRDITAQKAASRAATLLAAVVESSDDAIISKGLDGIVTSWNKAAERIFGYTAEEMVGAHITKLFPEDRLGEESNVIARISRGHRIEHFETVRKRKTGELIDVSLTISPIRDVSGSIIGASKIARDITSQKAAVRSHMLLAAIVDSSNDAIISKRLDGTVTSWNKAAERIFGYTSEEMIGQSITRLFPEDRLEEEPKIVARIGRGERVEHYETVRRTKDGRLLDVSLTISPVRDAQGLIVGASKIARDVSAQKRAEEELRRSEEQLRMMADSIPQLAWMADTKGNRFWYNRQWYQYTGTTLEEMVQRGWQSFHDPEILPAVKQRWEDSVSTGQPFQMEFPLRGADGVFRWFLTLVNPMRDSNGQVTRWFGTNTNIDTERKSRRALEEETRVLELLNKTGTVIGSELNLETLVQQVTDAGTQLAGAKFGAFFYNVVNDRGESFYLYALSGAPREAFEKLGLPRNTHVFNPTFRGEGIMRSDDITKDPRYGKMAPHYGMPKGHLPVRSYLAVPVAARSGEVIGGLFFGHPEAGVFTERAERLISGIASQAAVAIDNARLFEKVRRSEAALQKAKDELEHRVRERTASLQETTEQLETFCYSVAHDLRSPLRAQQTFAQELIDEHKDALSETGLEYARRILRSAERLDRLVNDLLTYSRLSRTEVKFETVSLGKVVNDVQKTYAAEIERSGAMVTCGNLHSVQAYEPMLNLILTNLITNGLKFMPPDQSPRLNIWSEQIDRSVRLWVSDNGIGIPPEGLNKIFGVFHRLHPFDKYPGTGIGLAIVQKGIERMGGRVGVESDLGKGSRFWIELPSAESA